MTNHTIKLSRDEIQRTIMTLAESCRKAADEIWDDISSGNFTKINSLKAREIQDNMELIGTLHDQVVADENYGGGGGGSGNVNIKTGRASRMGAK